MISQLVITFALFFSPNSGDSIPMFRKQLERTNIYMEPPPDFDSSGICNHYSGLMKIEINKLSKIVSFDISDGSPIWVKHDIQRQKDKKYINIKKLDSLALKEGLRNCIILFPLILETVDYPCKEQIKGEILNENYFHFGGKNLKGNIRFEKPIYFIFYKSKGDHDIKYDKLTPKDK